MTAYKVEICGVNTARLPMLREQEKEELMAALKKRGRGSQTEIY